MKRVKQTEYLRERLSISQQDFANFLGIPRSQLSMYELRKRSLPKTTIEKLAMLEILHYDMKQGKLEIVKSNVQHYTVHSYEQKIKNKIERLGKSSSDKKLGLERQLASMKQAYEKIAAWTKLVEHLIAVTAKDDEHKGDLLWLGIQQDQLAKKEVRHGKVVQALTEAKIAILDKEIEEYKKVLDTID